MDLREIMAISGQPGLYKFIAQSTNGVIVESLTDAKRMNVPSTARVSSLGEIAIFTDSEEMPLHAVLDAMFKETKGKEAISPKSSPDQIKEFFGKVITDYDRDRVHVSDMKKVISWFNLLIGAGMTEFTPKEEEKAE